MKGQKRRTIFCEFCNAKQEVKIRAGKVERRRCVSCGKLMDFFIPV
jgi:hypothetical protein